jgi:hypothetical protein
LYYSPDSGKTWQLVDFAVKNVNCLYPYGKDSVLVGTDDGVYVVSSTTVTAVNEPTHNPTTFALSQNYPNPFNPTTTIRYDVPVRSHVTLAAFDILGRRVETLVDGEKQPGHYEVSFDASRLPSGVYFYRLQVGTFNETKKMELLK